MLTIKSIIELLKQEGTNSKKQTIDLLSNLDLKQLYELKHNIKCLICKKEMQDNVKPQPRVIKFKGIELEEGTFTRKDFKDCFVLYDLKGNEIYLEDSSGYCGKWEYDEQGKVVYCEDSDGDCWKAEYDEQGNFICWKDPKGNICRGE